MSETENTTNEELTTTEKKKLAINVEDLIYVKKYIDDQHANFETVVDNKIASSVSEQVNTSLDEKFGPQLEEVNASIEQANTSIAEANQAIEEVNKVIENIKTEVSEDITEQYENKLNTDIIPRLDGLDNSVSAANTAIANNASAIEESNTAIVNNADAIAANTSAIEDIKMGIQVVGEATVARYASEDTSKGTIEERLANLGFKEGSIGLVSVLETNGTVQKNIVKKKGKYVLIDFEWDYWGDSGMEKIDVSDYTSFNVGRPNSEEFSTDADITACGYAVVNYYNTTTLTNETLVSTVTILAPIDGSPFSRVKIDSFDGYNNGIAITHIKFGIGYEAAPNN